MKASTVLTTFVGVAMAVYSHSILFAQLYTLPPQAKEVRDAIPPKVENLMSWPRPYKIAEKIVNPDASKESRLASDRTLSWIQTIISPEWLPENPEKMLRSKLFLLRQAFDGLDASYVEWEKSGYRFRVSQTRTIIYIEVTPTSGKIAENDMGAMRKASRELAAKLIADKPEVKIRHIADDVNVAVGGTKSILLRSCFDEAVVKQFDDGIVSQPAKPNPKIENDASRLHFWWGIMGWWTDGRTLGLFTPKAYFTQSGGDYTADEMDKHWLIPDPPEWQSKSGNAVEQEPESKE